MNLSSLRYFIEIADCKSFTKASERLFITQPTLSRQIQDLEEELGTRLFVREHHSLSLTEAGQRFLKEAKEIVKRCDNLRNVVKQKDEDLVGSLMIDYLAFMDTSLMYGAVKSLAKNNPHIDISLVRSGYTKIAQDLATDACDAAFTMKICIRDNPNIQYISLEKNKLQIAVPRNHRLAGRISVDVSELADENFIMLERMHSPLTVDYAVGLCNQNGFSPRTALYVDDIETSLLMVGAERGITFLFSRMNVNKEDVIILDLNYDSDDLDCVFAYRKDNQNPMIQVFMEEVETVKSTG